MKVVKRISLKKIKSVITKTTEKKRSVGRPKVFDEIKTYGFTFPPIYRKILQLAAKDNKTSASELIRRWIDSTYKDKYLDQIEQED